jgi:GNAT superfamily N-acetyltransferase
MNTTPTPPTASYRPRRLALRDGRAVTLRAIRPDDGPEIVQAFERLSEASRYSRFMQYRDHIDEATLERGTHPRLGRDFAFVATIPADDGIDIVGAAQYVGPRGDAAAAEADTGRGLCEFAVTVAEDWRGSGLASALMKRLLRRARRDGYATMEGWILAENAPMLALARNLGFAIERVPSDGTTVRAHRGLQRLPR